MRTDTPPFLTPHHPAPPGMVYACLTPEHIDREHGYFEPACEGCAIGFLAHVLNDRPASVNEYDGRTGQLVGVTTALEMARRVVRDHHPRLAPIVAALDHQQSVDGVAGPG
jgi:hypothetical protein